MSCCVDYGVGRPGAARGLTRNRFDTSNHTTLPSPAAAHTPISAALSGANRNSPRSAGTNSTSPSTTAAPPITHHAARFGARSVAKIDLDHDRFVRMSAQFEMSSVENASALARSSDPPPSPSAYLYISAEAPSTPAP